LFEGASVFLTLSLLSKSFSFLNLSLLQIPKAQPSQYNGPFPASFNGSRSSTNFYGKELPKGFFVCGDHMATATLNGAVESGVTAGADVAKAALSTPIQNVVLAE
jgi:hypothetical protein